MTDLAKDLRKMAASQCANYNRDGHCLLETSPGCTDCPFFGNIAGRCLYFERAVLPADDVLSARYWQALGVAYWGTTCKRCGQPFNRQHNRQQYCSTCREQVASARKAARNRRYYQTH